MIAIVTIIPEVIHGDGDESGRPGRGSGAAAVLAGAG
jgi:hypothetical protein